jgi:hypothetical protein
MFIGHRILAATAWTALLLTLVVGCAASTPEAKVPLTAMVTATLMEETRTPGSTPMMQSPTSAPRSPTVPPTASPATPVEQPYDDRGDPVCLLASYWNAINRREYERAWGYWENPPNPSYEDFVQGYAETASVLLAVSPPTRFEGAAGSVYVGIPTLLIATHLDGSQHAFVGCYVARRATLDIDAGGEWSLYSATVMATPADTADATLLAHACVTH